MIDDDNDMIQPNEKKDVSLRELHDPIEGDSASISWRGNSEVKSHAGRHSRTWILCLTSKIVSHTAKLTFVLSCSSRSQSS